MLCYTFSSRRVVSVYNCNVHRLCFAKCACLWLTALVDDSYEHEDNVDSLSMTGKSQLPDMQEGQVASKR